MPERVSSKVPRAFLSYSHDSTEHCERVLQLAQQLRQEGVESVIDRFVTSPPEGWPRWMQSEIERADYIIMVCTETYKTRFEGKEVLVRGLGVNWEGFLTTQMLYNDQALNKKCIPVLFEGAQETAIPWLLSGATRYHLPADYELLFRHLTGQPSVVPAAVGPLRTLPPLSLGDIASSGAPAGDALAGQEPGSDTKKVYEGLSSRALPPSFQSDLDQVRRWLSDLGVQWNSVQANPDAQARLLLALAEVLRDLLGLARQIEAARRILTEVQRHISDAQTLASKVNQIGNRCWAEGFELLDATGDIVESLRAFAMPTAQSRSAPSAASLTNEPLQTKLPSLGVQVTLDYRKLSITAEVHHYGNLENQRALSRCPDQRNWALPVQ